MVQNVGMGWKMDVGEQVWTLKARFGTLHIYTVGPNGHFRDIGQNSKIHKKLIEWAYEYCYVMGSKVRVDFCSQTMRKALNHGLSGSWLIRF